MGPDKGCQWKTVLRGGKKVRERSNRVASAVSTNLLASFSIADLLSEIKARMISGSPTFTADELKDAVVRLWLQKEWGYIAEVRRHPSLTPVYLSISRADADRLVARRPTAHFLANLFDWPEVPDQ
ncbi:MAG: hypothetical protein MUP81_01650 [Dehalococcoidia bacterium]|nr:hypothetical protein [Dehalococcoidia bacterium]